MIEQDRPAVDAEYDVVIIGSGGSGKMAALTAARGGLSVAILEKRDRTGGTSVFAEGMAAFESSEQKARGIPETEDGRDPRYPTRQEGYDLYLKYSHFRADPDVVRMFVDNSAEMIDVFKSLGVEYTRVGIYALDQPDELATFHRPDGLGARCQEALLAAVEDAGVDIFTSTRARRLILRDGSVAGVEATDAEGNALAIAAKAVVIATGGFVDNPELMQKYSLFGVNGARIWSMASIGNTGDGLTMALAAGGDTDNIGVLELGPEVRGKLLSSQTGAAGFQPWLWVNRTGKRFIAESIGMGFASTGIVLARQPNCDYFAILDADMIDYLATTGSDVDLGDFIGFHDPLKQLREELDRDIEQGEIAWKGDTLEELATNVGLPVEVFCQAVSEYNAACEAGYDPQFFKSANYLRPVLKPPFYAINESAGATCTCGGIRVNANLQVTDSDRTPIPGLYAVGNDASGLYGDAYTLDVPGSTNGFAHTSGLVAGRHIVGSLTALSTR